MSQGIPFAQGVLGRSWPVRVVDAGGRVYPTQARCLATWRDDLEYVRWLLVDTQIDHGLGKAIECFLEHGDSVQTPAPSQPVRVTERDGSVLVDTGALRFEIPSGGEMFRRCEVRQGGCTAAQEWRPVFAASPYLYMTGGRPYVPPTGRIA